MASTPADPRLALRWLSQVRRATVLAQLLLLGLARFGTEARMPVGPLLALLAVVGAVDLVERGRLAGRRVTPSTVLWHAAFDLVALTSILLLTGGSQNPLQAFYLVEVALLAIVLPGGAAWAATAAAVALQAVAALLALDVPGLDDEPHHHLSHLAGHVLAFDVAAVAITAFVGRLSAQLQEKAERLRALETRRAQDERLASLGTLAAGTAHALGTPLGAIELLAEELALAGGEGSREAHAELVGQLRRCRAILDRMLAGDEGAHGRTDGVGGRVAAWVAAWRAAHGAVAVELDVACPETATVRGVGEGWRDALWTVLDNARTAGGPIRVAARTADRAIEIVVEDSGPAVPAERLARAGQPFFSAWPERQGAGLGLYVARVFARAAGGDVTLGPCERGGARAILVLPLEDA